MDRKRRRIVKTLAVTAALGTSLTTGCLGDGESEMPDEDAGDGGEDTDDGADEVALDEPAEFPSDAECPVCEMMSAEYPDWNAQVAHEDGERAFTCSVGCMVAYVAYPDEFGVSDAAVAGVWVTSYETGELIDGFEAYYALETDNERVDDVMMLNPAAFENREDAIAYVDEVDYIDEEDVVEFDALDAETADMYRGQLTPDTEA
ncbi:MAG: nitrous oxide reductase accessory protein NosL [Halobacteriales archaeon]|nr:nitrous oxide reductase accessory protein NosL [Halobacteriales archaeon]